MDYADRLLSTPKAKKNASQDRFLSPVKKPRARLSLTPDISSLKRNQKSSPSVLSPAQSQERFCPRLSNPCSPLATCKSQACFQSPRKSSSGKQLDICMASPTSRKRHLPTKPIVVLDIGDIPLDFYISPLDWSKKDVIAMVFQTNLSFINPKTMENEIPPGTPDDILSLKFDPTGNNLFLGCNSGDGQIYDTLRYVAKTNYQCFDNSILCNDWKENLILAGSRNGSYVIIDDRAGKIIHNDRAHNEELCNIRFSNDIQLFATSSNDCSIKIWDQRRLDKPICHYEEHEAAVKAVAWSPFSKNIIATGGGTSDKNIKIWDINTGETINSVNTGSQVCNLFWNENYNEIVSTHGFSQNHIALWKGNDLTSVGSFHTHKDRILYMAASSDGQFIVTAACNDTIQIWKLFPQKSFSMSESILMLR